MTVKELMNKLAKCSSNAIVCIDANQDCLANEVQEYEGVDNVHYVYIADELGYIDEVFIGKRI